MRDLWIWVFLPFQLEKAARKHFVYGKKTSWRNPAKATTSHQEEFPQTERPKNKIWFFFKQHQRRKDVGNMTQVNKSITFCFHPEEKTHNPRGETNQRALVRLLLRSSDGSGCN